MLLKPDQHHVGTELSESAELQGSADPLAEGGVPREGVERLDAALLEPALDVRLHGLHLREVDPLVHDVHQLEERDAPCDDEQG